MKKTWKKTLSFLMSLTMVITMIPAVALAADNTVTLKIDDGSIVISDTGYRRGNETSETSHTGNYIITQESTSQISNKYNVYIQGVADGATVTLQGLNLNFDDSNNEGVGAVNVTGGTVELVLSGTNTLAGGYRAGGALAITKSAKVTISGTGTLKANHGTWTPGIYVAKEATLTIESGTINATGTTAAAGIGANYKNNAGTIIINGGTVTAKGGAYEGYASGAGIGGTSKRSAVKVEINGGNVTATSGKTSEAADIIAGSIVINGGDVSLANAKASTTLKNASGDTVSLTKLYFTDADGTVLKKKTVSVSVGNNEWTAKTDAGGFITTYLPSNHGTVSAKMNGQTVTVSEKVGFDLTKGNITFDGTKYTQNNTGLTYTPSDENEQVVVYGEGKTTNSLIVTGGAANVLLSDVDLTNETDYGKWTNGSYTGFIQVRKGTLNLALQGENKLYKNATVIFVGAKDSTTSSDAVLNIDCADENCNGEASCQHKLEITGANHGYCSTIGAVRGMASAGTININGGNLDVTVKSSGVGIGVADGGTQIYDINITDGNVKMSTTKDQIAMIGMGRNAGEDSVANINITGGKVDISTTKQDNPPVGIGAGDYAKGNVNITIGSDNAGSNDEPVVKVSNTYGSAIGKTANSNADMSIIIKSGTVNASGNVAIGYAMNGSHDYGGHKSDITISGGNVTANGGHLGIGAVGPAIYGQPGRTMDVNINITGGSVKASGAHMAVGVCEAGTDTAANIKITGEDTVVEAISSRGIGVGTALGYLVEEDDDLSKTTTSIEIDEAATVVLNAATPIAAATETTITGATEFTIEGNSEDEDITISVPEGSSITVTDDGTIVLQKDKPVTITDGDGTETTVTVTEGTGSISSDGDVTLDAGSAAEVTTGEETTIITAPENSEVTIEDGDITLPAGTEVTDENGNTTTIPDTVTSVTVPVENVGGVEVDEETGDITLPEGSSVINANGTTIDMADGGTIEGDGSVELTPGTSTTITTENGEEITVTLPSGESGKVNADGTTTLPEGTVITTEDNTSITLTSEGTLTEDGMIVAEGTVTITDKNGESVYVLIPDGEQLVINGDEVTLPGGTTLLPNTKISGNVDTVTIPVDAITDVEKDADGNIILPADSVVVTDDGKTVTLPDGGKLTENGAVVAEGETTVTITDANGETTTVVLPEGTSASVDANGIEVTVSEEAAEDAAVEITLPDGTVVEVTEGSGSVDNEGAFTLDENSSATVTVTNEEGNKTETTVTTGEGASATVSNGEIEATAGEGEEGGSVTITTEDGTEVEVTEGTAFVTEEGTVVLEGGSSVTITDESDNSVEVTIPDDAEGSVSDGDITLPAGATITDGEGNTTTIPDTVTSVTVPVESADEVEYNEETGILTLPADSTATTENGAIELPAGGSVDGEGNVGLEAGSSTTIGDTTIQLPEDEGATITDEGIELPAGSEVTVGGTTVEVTEGNASVNENGEVIITGEGEDGTSVEIEDTTVTVPAGGSATVTEDGVTLPGGATIGGGDDVVTIPEDVSVTIPADKLGDVTENEDGSVTLPEGSTVITENGTTVEGEVTIDADGNVVVSEGDTVTVTTDGTSVEITAGDGDVTMTEGENGEVVIAGNGEGDISIEINDTTVGIPAGASAIVTEDGVTLPAGTTIGENAVEVPETVTSVTVPADKLDDVTVDAEGSITLPAGSTVTKEDGTTVSLPNGGQITPYGEVIVTPGADSGDDNEEEDNSTPSRPSTGNGSSSKKYAVSIDKDDIENGSVKANTSKAKKGATVTITVTPDEGYELDELKVLDDDDDEVKLTDKGNGKFTFKMPRGGVKVDASFKEADSITPADSEDEKKIVLTIDSTLILIDGEYVVNDVAPIIRNERTVLPIRVIAEALGATVTWNEAEQTVTIVKGDTTIVLYIGQAFALVNGDPVQLDAPAFIENGRTYLPLRFIMENLGASVVWDGLTKTVTILG